MRSCCLFLAVFFLPVSALAAEFTVKIVDPQSAAVPGAQVELFAENSTHVLGIQTTSAQGVAQFREAPSGNLRVHVLAPGFAEHWQSISTESREKEVMVSLHLAVATETVVVTATRNPAPSNESGAAIDTLSGTQLETLRPIAAEDALRFLPGAIVATNGQRGGLGSLFVRGGDSRYNKVIVDGVPVNDPGGTFDFGTIPLFEEDRLEFLRGSQSTLYGSDAMTSVVQTWSRTGSTSVPELGFGADAGNYGTENGYASLAGANGRFDYNIFSSQFNTSGSGPNDDYSNSLEGANLGAKLNDWASLRLRMRHDNSVSGVQGAWDFNGDKLLPPDLDQRARQSNFLGSLELVLSGPSRWQHRVTGFDYTLGRVNRDDVPDRGCDVTVFNFLDCFFDSNTRINRAGFDYQGGYSPVSWTQSVLGFEFEDEDGDFFERFLSSDANNNPFIADSINHGLRRNASLYFQQQVTRGRISATAGVRYVHNESFGNRVVPRAAISLLTLRGGHLFSGTRLNFDYAEGIKEPSFLESFGDGGTFKTIPNPSLKPEQTRALETGFEQNLTSRYSFSARYFNNLFRDKIDFNFLPCFCAGQYVNVNEAIAHGAEVGLHGRPVSRLSFGLSYTYTSTQILKQPFAFDPLLMSGQPLLRRPKHSATALMSYLGSRWGADLASSFVGRRADSDFLGFGIDHAPGYVLVNSGGWYAATSRVTAYVNVENLLNRSYNEVVGYPTLGINFRAGMRFRVGGE